MEPERKTILAVDDDPQIVTSLKESLDDSAIGFELLSAADTYSACKVADLVKPHLIIASGDEHEDKGMQLVRKLKLNPGTKHIPVIITLDPDSGYPPMDITHQEGILDFVRTPINKSELITRIRTI